jgi:hypothetical protein
LVTDDHFVDEVWELLHSTLLEHVLLLQHAPMDNILVEHLSQLLHSTPWSASFFFNTS